MSYGLVSKEDMRFNFGLADSSIPEVDSDLEAEITKYKTLRDVRYERITMGIDHNIGQ
jgi:hypothetical protein